MAVSIAPGSTRSPDSTRTELDGSRLGHAPIANLLATYAERPRRSDQSCDRGRIHDGTPSSFTKGGRHRLHAQPTSHLVDRDDTLVFVQRHLFNEAVHMDTGIVDQDGQFPERHLSETHRFLPVTGGCHVQRHIARRAPRANRPPSYLRRAGGHQDRAAPSATNWRAMASPWPCAAPVTIATPPSSRPTTGPFLKVLMDPLTRFGHGASRCLQRDLPGRKSPWNTPS